MVSTPSATRLGGAMFWVLMQVMGRSVIAMLVASESVVVQFVSQEGPLTTPLQSRRYDV